MEGSTWLHELTNDKSNGLDEMQHRIIDAAYELFVTFGLRRTTIEDIAKKAGVGRPTVYRRFGDKETIVNAVLRRESRRMVLDVGERVKGITPPEQLLMRSFVMGVQTVAQHPLTQRLLQSEPEDILPYLTLKASPLLDIGHFLTSEYVRAQQEAGKLVGLDVNYALEVLGRLFISIIITPSRLLRADDDESLERLANEFLLPLLEKCCGSNEPVAN